MVSPAGPLSFALYVQEKERLVQPAFVEGLLQRVIERRYQWVDFWERLGERGGYVLHGPAVSPQALACIQSYLRGEPSASNRKNLGDDHTELNLHARREIDILQDLDVMVFPELGAIEFTVDDELLFGCDKADAEIEIFLDLIKALGLFSGAFYGTIVDPVAAISEFVFQTGRPKNISSINFWGPEIVALFGKERVLALPAWHNELLSNGSVLLLPDHSFGTVNLHIPFAFKKIQVALGFPTPDPELEWCEDVYDDPEEWEKYLATLNKEQ
jgi:hypothetical protein